MWCRARLNFPQPEVLAQLQLEARKGGDYGGSSKSASKFRGVSWNSNNSSWHVSLKVQGKQHFLGTFVDEIVAAQAFDAAATRLLPAESHNLLNFPNAEILSIARQHTAKEAMYKTALSSRRSFVSDEAAAARALDRACARISGGNATLNCPTLDDGQRLMPAAVGNNDATSSSSSSSSSSGGGGGGGGDGRHNNRATTVDVTLGQTICYKFVVDGEDTWCCGRVLKVTHQG
eukprot:COSAG05_NODE_1431_length_4907_cov_4.952579_2_plen_232_part_00